MNCLTVFSGPIPHFCTFFLSHDFLVVSCWFSAISLIIFCLLLQSELLTCILLVTTTWFVAFVKCFVDFVAPVSTCFFCVKIGVLDRFIFARFAFFYVFFAIVCACAFDTFIFNSIATIERPKSYQLPSLFGFLTSPKLD